MPSLINPLMIADIHRTSDKTLDCRSCLIDVLRKNGTYSSAYLSIETIFMSHNSLFCYRLSRRSAVSHLKASGDSAYLHNLSSVIESRLNPVSNAICQSKNNVQDHHRGLPDPTDISTYWLVWSKSRSGSGRSSFLFLVVVRYMAARTWSSISRNYKHTCKLVPFSLIRKHYFTSSHIVRGCLPIFATLNGLATHGA